MKKETVFVTGSGRGIGRAIALEFAKNGHPVVINPAHNEQQLSETQRAILSYNVPCLSFLGDLKEYQNVSSIYSEIKEALGAVDILINNAGISYVGLFQDMSSDEYTNLISNNLLSAMHCSHLVIPDMIHNKSGKIINISSVWGERGASCEVAYSASKGAMNSFTKALAKELAPSNIQVNAVACGLIDTDMNKIFTKEDIELICEEIPAGRMGLADEVAKFVYTLATGHSYLTGQIINIDGGWQ